MSMIEYQASNIGAAAYHALQHDQSAAVIGITSRGIFVRAANDRVFFLSHEKYRGPLTLNLQSPHGKLEALDVGANVEAASGRLIFPSIRVAVTASPDAIWRPSIGTAPARPLDEQRHTLRSIASEVVARKGDDGFSAVLPSLLGLPADRPPSSLLDNILSLQQALAAGNVGSMVEFITGLLGSGRGLTPSGDDCVMGLLLILNRWQNDVDWSSLNQRVIEAAYQRTTTISANLIECAATGEADERLIAVADGIVTGTPSEDVCVDYALDWGSSSGIDALVGTAIAITAGI